MHFTNKNSKSKSLVRLIGIPGICEPATRLENKDIPRFLPVAQQNKIPLLFLETAANNIESHNIQAILSLYQKRHRNALDLMTFTANLLEEKGISYTFFKTLKPFPHTPSDIDILLWSDENLKTITKELKIQGCIPLEKNTYGVTLFSPKHKMNIDLTTQIAVSGLIYVNKELLFDYTGKVEKYGTTIHTVETSADLIVVAAHNMFKEQMYTLNDYYTFAMLTQHWKKAAKIAKEFHLEHALYIILKMAKTITLIAFGPMSPLMKKFEEAGVTNTAELISEDFELPKKYDIATLAVAFLKKIKADPISLNSLPLMARSASKPFFYKKIVEHAIRKTY